MLTKSQNDGLGGLVAVVTGGTGVLGGEIALGLAAAGARVGVLGRNRARADATVGRIIAAGGEAIALIGDVLRVDELQSAKSLIHDTWGDIDILVNAAGGHVQEALTTADRSFFDLPEEALQAVIDLNLMGTILPSQVFGASMADASPDRASGSIINISSMAAERAITRVVGYGAAKAGINNFTLWAACELARGARPIRVNAVAPGFFVAETNKTLLMDDAGPTERGHTIISRTPAGRFGDPRELVGAVVWLASKESSFVTGTIIPVDGGFSAFSGV